jgi:hypothetical protein
VIGILEFKTFLAGTGMSKILYSRAYIDVGVPRPGGSLSRRVNVAACPSPDGSSARASAKGGERGGRRPA